MNPRIVKKLSKRSKTLLERLQQGLWYGLSEKGETPPENEGFQRAVKIGTKKGYRLYLDYFDVYYADNTPICAWPGLDSCGEGDEGRSVWKMFREFVEEELTVYEDPNDWTNVTVIRPKLRNPSEIIRKGRAILFKYHPEIFERFKNSRRSRLDFKI